MRRLLVLVPLVAGCSIVPDPFSFHPTFLPDSCQYVVQVEDGYIRARWETGRHLPCTPCVEGVVEVETENCGKGIVP